MALFPRPGGTNSRYYISDTKAKAEYDPKTNDRVFRGGGTDYSDSAEIVYIASVPLERVVPLKAFISSVKLNLQKEIEKSDKLDRSIIYDREFSSEVSYDISLDLPAHSTNEAANNLAKIEELQRLIMPTHTSVSSGASNRTGKLGDREVGTAFADGSFQIENARDVGVDSPLFVVWFRNIINSGHKSIKTKKTTNSFKDILDLGFSCYIEEVNYEPDMAAGFFENTNQLFPKNIKLTLKLNYDSHTLQEYRKNLTLAPFMSNGAYSENDTSLFPFGVTVRGTSGFAERPNEITKSSQEMTQEQMNDISTYRNSTYLFVSLPIASSANSAPPKGTEDKDAWYEEVENKRTRYVVFPAFFESFSRRNKVQVKTMSEQGAPIFKKLGLVAPSSLDYNFKLNVVSHNLQEAKQNCAKIQYLIRMFVKREASQVTNLPDAALGGAEAIIAAKEAQAAGGNDATVNTNTRFYIPKKLERPGSSGAPTDFKSMYNNSMEFLFESLDLDINLSEGFFVESARLFPKSMSITIGITDTDNQYMSAIVMKGNDPTKGEYYLHSDGTLNEADRELFPFNQKTSKFITIGE